MRKTLEAIQALECYHIHTGTINAVFMPKLDACSEKT